MTDYTIHHNIPYPEGGDRVAVHTDVEALAVKVDVELYDTHHLVGQAVRGAVPEQVENLVDYDATVSGTLSPTGLVLPHDFNRVSAFIPVLPGQRYVSRSSLGHRVVWFDSGQNAIAGTNTDWLPGDQTAQHTAPLEARWVRFGIALGEGFTPDIIFNRGTTLWAPDEPVVSDWWSDRELPPNQPVRLADLTFAQDGKISNTVVDGAVPARVQNLFDPTQTVPGTLSRTGLVIEDATNNRTTDFIAVDPGEPYVAMTPRGFHRIVWFDSNRNAIEGTNTDYTTTGVTSTWTAPDNAAYVRMGVSLGQGVPMDGIIFNWGTTLWSPDEPVSTGFWDDRELPPGTGEAAIDERKIQEIVDALLPQWEPDTPTLSFETISTGTHHPLWLTSDGSMFYGRDGRTLIQSSDEWATREVIHQFPIFIMGVRALNDGELLVSTSRNNDTNLLAKVYKSSGYTPDDPAAATWTEVLESPAPNANINNDWGMQVYENIVILGEYGLHGEDGARRVWMSEDHGDTFQLVFDLKTVEAEGRPEWHTQAHLHTPAWDPYWSRLWVAVGDGPNTATYYSDDKGDTWTFVEGSNVVQYTGIIPLPGAVIFGSDRDPNGVHVYRRGQKTDMPVIRPLLIIDDETTLTRVFMLPYKRDWAPDTPTYFAAQPAGVSSPASVITATVDGRKAHQLWEGERPDTNAAHSGYVMAVFGPTAQGNLIAPMTNDPTVTGSRIMKAPAPTWTRV